MNRREFLQSTAAVAAGLLFTGKTKAIEPSVTLAPINHRRFRYGLDDNEIAIWNPLKDLCNSANPKLTIRTHSSYFYPQCPVVNPSQVLVQQFAFYVPERSLAINIAKEPWYTTGKEYAHACCGEEYTSGLPNTLNVIEFCSDIGNREKYEHKNIYNILSHYIWQRKKITAGPDAPKALKFYLINPKRHFIGV